MWLLPALYAFIKDAAPAQFGAWPVFLVTLAAAQKRHNQKVSPRPDAFDFSQPWRPKELFLSLVNDGLDKKTVNHVLNGSTRYVFKVPPLPAALQDAPVLMTESMIHTICEWICANKHLTDNYPADVMATECAVRLGHAFLNTHCHGVAGKKIFACDSGAALRLFGLTSETPVEAALFDNPLPDIELFNALILHITGRTSSVPLVEAIGPRDHQLLNLCAASLPVTGGDGDQDAALLETFLNRHRGAFVMNVSAGALFRQTQQLTDVRRQLVDSRRLCCVIRMPQQSVTCGQRNESALLFVNHADCERDVDFNDRVVFIDATALTQPQILKAVHDTLKDVMPRWPAVIRQPAYLTDISGIDPAAYRGKLRCAVTDHAAIARTDYDLSVHRYFLSDRELSLKQAVSDNPKGFVRLKDIAEITACRALKKVVPAAGSEALPSDVFYGHELLAEDLDPFGFVRDGIARPRETFRNQPLKNGVTLQQTQRLIAGDIVIRMRSRSGDHAPVTLWPANTFPGNRAFYAGQTYAVVRLKPGVDTFSAAYLYRWLTRRDVQEWLMSQTTAGTMIQLTKTVLGSVPVAVPADKAELDKADDACFQLRQDVARWHALKKSIMHDLYGSRD